MSNQSIETVRVWDLPLRVFHWALLATVIGLFVTAKIGGDAMKWHFYFGYTVLSLLSFRLIWGIIGSRYAQFKSFPPNPLAAWRTLRSGVSTGIGHTPLGAFSVYAFLLSLCFQAVSGLFSNDDIAAQGPLAVNVSKDLSDQITSLHKLNEKVIIGLVALHLLAMCYYHFVKKQALVKAMVTGDKQGVQGVVADDSAKTRWRGLGVFALCATTVWLLVNKF